MQPLIDIEVDGMLANYGQVLLTTVKPKVERNLIKLQPLHEFVLNQRNQREKIIVAVASVCEYVIFYEEEINQGCCMYFMPYYTPQEVKIQILQDKELIGCFDQLANDIIKQQNFSLDIQFLSYSGAVNTLRRPQLN